ncbi:MAG: class I SAM-dependent methyltransferase [Aggregatilineales bacterium]
MRDSSVNFDRAADFYDATRGFPEGEDQHVAKFVADVAGLPSNARVLEIGIGTGRIALPLSRTMGEFYGIDISEKMLERLRQKQTDEAVFVSVGDAMRLPFANGIFDAVVIVHVLHLVKDPDKVLAEVGRVLNPDGVVLKCQNQTNVQQDATTPLNDAWLHATRKVRSARDLWRNVDVLMQENGWSSQKPAQSYRYQTLTTPQDFLDRVESRAWSSTWDMPDDIWQAGVNAVKAAIEEHFGGDATVQIQQEAGFEVEVFGR